MNRRKFIYCAAATAAGAGLGFWPLGSVRGEDKATGLPTPGEAKQSQDDEYYTKPAMFYRKLGDNRIQCQLCPRGCEVGDGDRGHCEVRENRSGSYHTLNHSRAVALNNDPIEKKPFNHFRPGTMVLSVAAAGCNIHCKFCQNWQISQFRPEEVGARYLPPETLIKIAKKNDIPNIAFTYAEPTVFYEYMYDTHKAAHEAGIGAVVVSNGFISPEAVKKLRPFLSAYKVDLKAFTESYYRDYCSAELKPVLKTLETIKSLDLWLEIVTLVLPTANDDEKDIRSMARWIKANLGDTVPIHFTRFHPMYKIRNLPPTPVSTLERCHQTAKAEGLKYVYVGNVPGHPDENTYCHNCGHLLIKRTGLWAVEPQMDNGRCPNCHTEIPGVWV